MQDFQFLVYQYLLQGAGAVWISVGLLVGLLIGLIFRPDRIQSTALLKAACWCLALAIVVPTLLQAGAQLFSIVSANSWRGGYRGASGGESAVFMAVGSVSGVILQGLGVLFGLLAFVPRRLGPPQGPIKHPME